jgi:hypothetical protein
VDATYTDPMGAVHDRASLAAYVETTVTAFPDRHVEPQAVVGRDGRLSVHVRRHAGGAVPRLRADGRVLRTPRRRVDGEAIAEAWNATNSTAMARQLGLLG